MAAGAPAPSGALVALTGTGAPHAIEIVRAMEQSRPVKLRPGGPEDVDLLLPGIDTLAFVVVSAASLGRPGGVAREVDRLQRLQGAFAHPFALVEATPFVTSKVTQLQLRLPPGPLQLLLADSPGAAAAAVLGMHRACSAPQRALAAEFFATLAAEAAGPATARAMLATVDAAPPDAVAAAADWAGSLAVLALSTAEELSAVIAPAQASSLEEFFVLDVTV